MLTERELFNGYQPVPDRIARAHMTEQLLLERIGELRRYRTWYRRQTAIWDDLRQENDHELRSLLKLARRARRLSAGPAITESELRLLDGNR